MPIPPRAKPVFPRGRIRYAFTNSLFLPGCRKKSPFFDARPCGAEKIRCFLTLDPPAQKKLVVF